MGIIEIIGRHGGTQINLFGIPSAPAVADQYGQNRSNGTLAIPHENIWWEGKYRKFRTISKAEGKHHLNTVLS